jgi:hypothetical protein
MGFYQIERLFEPGKLLVSQGVINSGIDYHWFIGRHFSGDWGNVSDYDAKENRRAIMAGEAVLSQYYVDLPSGASEMLCIITETSIHTVVFFLNESPVPHEQS